ncbi:FHA domain-containing protein [Neobacillus bataviensis]|uniref:FHA domain-containing protein n=1 Tax=Neobacillus bataviensis TaxID=220685 RepID=UPI001CBB28E8|nr:FHA domain-containing protein [Neobacillus bataviensis]
MIKHLNFKVESYGISKFFFYHVPSEVEIDGEAVDYISHNRAAGILPLAVLKKEEDLYIRYDQVSDFTVERLFSQKLTKEHLTAYLLKLVDGLIELQESPLVLDHLLLDKKYIFLDHFSNRLVFMYIPIKNNIFEKVSMKEFLRDLVAAAPYDEGDDGAFFIRLHNNLTGEAEIDLAEFKEKLVGFSNAGGHEEKPARVEAPDEELDGQFYSPGQLNISEVLSSVDNGMLTSQNTSRKADKKTSQKLEIEEEVQYKRITRTELGEGDSVLKSSASIAGTSINIVPNYHASSVEEEQGGTTVLGVYQLSELQGEGTTVLGMQEHSVPRPFLLFVQSGEKITVSKDVFKLGRDPEQADYASVNKAVGRIHAEVVMEDGEYFLIDQQSRNGSYLNGKKVLPLEKVKLRHEDTIKLANEEYVFKLF